MPILFLYRVLKYTLYFDTEVIMNKENFRMEFINHHSYIFGGIRRKHIMSRFGVNKITASKEIKKYNETYKGHLNYDVSKRSYVITKKFKLLSNIDIDIFLMYISSGIAPVMTYEPYTDYSVVKINKTNLINIDNVKYILRSLYLESPVSIKYINSKSVISERIIEPIELIKSGMFWYVKALCQKSLMTKLFLLNRVISSKTSTEASQHALVTDSKSSQLKITMVANEDYKYHSVEVTEQEYNFQKEFTIVIDEIEKKIFLREWPVYWEGVTSDIHAKKTLKLRVSHVATAASK